MSAIQMAIYTPRVSSLLNPRPRASSPPPPPLDNARRRRKKKHVDMSIREILLRHKAAREYKKMKRSLKAEAKDDKGGDGMYGPPQAEPSQDSRLRAEGSGGPTPNEDQPGSAVSDDNGQLVDDGPYSSEGAKVVDDGKKASSILRLMVEEWDCDEETEDTTSSHADTDGEAGDFIRVNLDTTFSATEMAVSFLFINGRGMWAGLRDRVTSAAGAPARGPTSGAATPTPPGRGRVPDRVRYPQLDAHSAQAQENHRPGRGEDLLLRLPFPTVVLMIIAGIAFLLRKGKAMFS